MERRRREHIIPWHGCIGVDPGSVSGSIAYVTKEFAKSWPVASMTDREIWELMHLIGPKAEVAAVEQVHSMPKQGVASSFKFGASFGQLRMAVVACGVAFQLVTPNKWQTKMNCKTGGDKKITRELAQRLWPQLKITNNNADSLLLAEYARRHIHEAAF